MKNAKKERASTACALCQKPIDETAIMATNPGTGKMALMHQACWKIEMDKARRKFQNDVE